MATSQDVEVGRENSDTGFGLGAKLKAARKAKELTIEEVAAELRIGVPLLNALEDGEYEALGPPVFAKGYLKQYGARLGLQVPELVADYEQTVGNQSIEIAPTRTITLRDERHITTWIVAALVLAVISAVVWFWWWLGTDRAETPAAVVFDDGPALPEEPAAIANQAAPAVEPPAVVQAAANTDPETEFEVATGVAAEPVLEPVPEPAADPVPESYAGPELEIVFIADSWTDITAESGERLFYDLGRAGTGTAVPADRNMNLFFGNAAGVELRIDGQPYAIPATARRRGNTAQWDFAARADESVANIDD
jgi:cytoskeleton protein RodZ